MTEYEVVVYTRVQEVYVVQAESREEARETWMDGDSEMISQECIEVEEVTVREQG